MTQEEKDLLLKDLCARLPYKVKINCGTIQPFHTLVCIYRDIEFENSVDYMTDDGLSFQAEDIKSYLRPMDSMTEEEYSEFFNYYHTIETEFLKDSNYTDYLGAAYASDNAKFDWLNAHYFDYRGLIEKGLALEAPKDMYREE